MSKAINKELKTESVKEFLARGGKIQKVPAVAYEEKDITVRTTNSGPVLAISKSSSAFKCSLSDEDFSKLISKVEGLSKEEKDKLLEMVEDRSEISFQTPSLEDAALLFGESTKRKKKEKFLDEDVVKTNIEILSDEILTKIGLK